MLLLRAVITDLHRPRRVIIMHRHIAVEDTKAVAADHVLI